MASSRPLRLVPHRKQHAIPPAHHVLAPAASEAGWSSWLLSWYSSTPEQSEPPRARTGFRNPWPSFHRPNLGEVWAGLEWGSQPPEPADDPSLVDLALGKDEAQRTKWREERRKEEVLTVVQPVFGGEDFDGNARCTWLGHAGVLLQLPALGTTATLPNGTKAAASGSSSTARSLNILFDPIFSERCSPTQYAGPIRSFPAPCPPSALPPIDVILISHNHYDHLDNDTITEIWALNKDHLRFVVPLGNQEWFTAPPLNVPAERVTELDWWDEAIVTLPTGDFDEEEKSLKSVESNRTLVDVAGAASDRRPDSNEAQSGAYLRIICTPAQHNSGRTGLDSCKTLWSSWMLEHVTPSTSAQQPGPNPSSCRFRAFFGGDSGLQFHGPEGPSDTHSLHSAPSPYPRCPAFEEISARVGAPHFSLLPISVGATISFLKSYDPFPAFISPFPRIDSSVTSAGHMGPWGAVRVQRLMRDAGSPKGSKQGNATPRPPVSMAIHWGTFVGGPDEVTHSIRELRRACAAQGVKFTRKVDRAPSSDEGQGTFVIVNHGESISLSLDEYADETES